jgi:hypothetical protein
LLLLSNVSVSPAPKANEYLAKENFYTEMATAKIAAALGVNVHAIVGRSRYAASKQPTP